MKLLFVLIFSLFVGSNSYGQENLHILWQTDSLFKHPESIVYNAKKSCFYVSNLDKNTPSENLYTDAISKVCRNGNKVKVDCSI